MTPSAASACRPVAQPVADVRGALDQAFAAHDRQVGQAGGAGGRVTRVGEAVAQEEVGVGLERGTRRGPDEHAAERLVAGGDRLGEGHQVGPHAVVLRGEPRAEAAEAGDDLVEDQVRAVLVAQPAELLQVLIGRREDAAGALHRLGQHRGDRVAVLGHQRWPAASTSSDGTCTTSSTNGPKFSRFGAMPCALVPP